MNTNINIDNLLNIVHQYYDAEEEYNRKSKTYLRKHGHGVYFYNGKKLTDEEQRIEWACRSHNEMWNVLMYLGDVLELDKEQWARLYIASRALRRWYNDTKWERLPSHELQARLGAFIFEKEA